MQCVQNISDSQPAFFFASNLFSKSCTEKLARKAVSVKVEALQSSPSGCHAKQLLGSGGGKSFWSSCGKHPRSTATTPGTSLPKAEAAHLWRAPPVHRDWRRSFVAVASLGPGGQETWDLFIFHSILIETCEWKNMKKMGFKWSYPLEIKNNRTKAPTFPCDIWFTRKK